VFAVPLFVDLHVPQPKIGGEINHFHALAQEARGRFGGGAVRETEKNEVRILGDGRHVQLLADQAGFAFEEFMDLVDRLTREPFRGHMRERHLRMADEVAQKLPARIPARSNDGNSNHGLLPFVPRIQ